MAQTGIGVVVTTQTEIFSFSINEAGGSLDHNRPFHPGSGVAAVVNFHSLL